MDFTQIITDVETIVGAISLVAGIISGYLGKRQKEKRKKRNLNYTEIEKQELLAIADQLQKNGTVYKPKQKPLIKYQNND